MAGGLRTGGNGYHNSPHKQEWFVRGQAHLQAVASVECGGAPGSKGQVSTESQMTAFRDGAGVSVQSSGHMASWEARRRGCQGEG